MNVWVPLMFIAIGEQWNLKYYSINRTRKSPGQKTKSSKLENEFIEHDIGQFIVRPNRHFQS